MEVKGKMTKQKILTFEEEGLTRQVYIDPDGSLVLPSILYHRIEAYGDPYDVVIQWLEEAIRSHTHQ